MSERANRGGWAGEKKEKKRKNRERESVWWLTVNIFAPLVFYLCYRGVWLASWRVSPDFKRIQAPAFSPHYICFRITSGIELGQIHYTVAMETKAQMLIKCVRVCVFFSRQIDSMKQTACMHATFRADWQQNFLCVCLSWKVWLRLGMLK